KEGGGAPPMPQTHKGNRKNTTTEKNVLWATPAPGDGMPRNPSPGAMSAMIRSVTIRLSMMPLSFHFHSAARPSSRSDPPRMPASVAAMPPNRSDMKVQNDK